ncbi:MAG: hypothetical protein H7X77_03890, partial [Anaerolineae bacterium]|nr:hypothetical protein [Anaerolineae bacterium]
MSRHRFLASVWVGLTTLLVILTTAFAQSAGSTQEGWLSVIWGDGQVGTRAHTVAYVLSLDNGENIYLDIHESVLAAGGGLTGLNGQRVQITANDLSLRGNNNKVAVSSIKLAPLPMIIPQGAGNRAVTGSQPWVTIMCEFPGNPEGEGTETLNYFEEMYNPDFPGMDHYWREQSFNKVDLLGSEAYGWFTLPHNQSFYIPNPGSNFDADLDALRADCVAAANATVNFAPFIGINMMFNGVLDCCAWGGGDFLTIDGVSKLWRLTWNPPWSWADITVVSHEIGHGFGLPHANNFDGDNSPYDTPWDVMSDTYSFCNLSIDPTYGCLGQHTNAGYKDFLGWFGNNRRLEVTGSTGEVNLDHAALADADDYQIIIVPIPNSSVFYAVEARQTTNSGYDKKLPGKAVIIWEMDASRQEDAWQVGAISDATSQSVSDGPDGAWLPGETFTDDVLSISVISETTDGFVVAVTLDASQLISNGGMESDSNNDKVPDGWNPKNFSGDKFKCDQPEKIVANNGSCAFAFKGGAGEKSGIGQTPVIPAFNDGDSLAVSLFVNASNPAVDAKVKMIVVYTDTSLVKEKVLLPFAVTSGYTELTNDVVLQSGDVSKIKFNIQNKSLAGKVYVDDVSVQWNEA